MKKWLEKWTNDSSSKLYTPYRVGDCLVVFGEISGIIVFPRNYDKNLIQISPTLENKLTFKFLKKVGHRYSPVEEDESIDGMDASWLKDYRDIISIAYKYMEENASPMYYENSNVQCGYQLPWKS